MKDDSPQKTGPEKIGQRIPNGMLQDNYPRNMWWVAAHRDEVTTKPLSRWLLETPVVLYRLEDGTPAALYDRCPHRWAPLSEGHVRDDKIICPYHGMEFNTGGRCTKAPTQTMMPKADRANHMPRAAKPRAASTSRQRHKPSLISGRIIPNPPMRIAKL